MKVIDRSLEILPQSAARIASSMETAAATVAEQGKAFANDVAGCALSLKTDVETIAGQLAAIPPMIDPAPVLECCTEALKLAANDLRRLGSDAGAIPTRLLEQVATVQQVVDQAVSTAKSLPGAIPALSSLVPDFGAQLAFFQGLPARGDELAGQARRTVELFEHYGRQLIPLSQQLAQLPAQGDAGVQMRQVLTAQASALKSDSLAQVGSLRGMLQAGARDLNEGVDGASSAALKTIGGAADLLRKTGSDLLAPLQAQIEFVERMQGAFSQEATACDALFDDCAAQLGRVGDIVFKPMTEARLRVDAVIDQLKAAAANVDAMLKKTLQPIDALEVRADTIKQALDDVVSVVGEEVRQIQGLLAELDADAEKAKAALLALPENFTPVRASIAEAVAMLEEIKGRIPLFVAQANRALDGAAAELDQADGLCNSAIEICTRHMMKAPPLMAARTLFVGVKSMIPGVKTAIAAARKSVEAAGTNASGLLTRGIATVEALNPLLDQAIAAFQASIDALVALLVKLQAALQQVTDTLGAIPPELSIQLENAASAMHQVLDKVHAAVEQCLAKLQCEALVQRMQQELSALLDRTVATVDQKIKDGSAPLHGALQQGREAVGKAAALAQESLRTLHSALTGAKAQAQKPILQLGEMMASWQAKISGLSSGAKLQIAQAEAKLLAGTDHVAQKIAGLTIDIPNLPAEVLSAVGTFPAIRSSIGAVADGGGARSLQDWRTEAERIQALIESGIDNASAQASQGLAQVRAASDNLRADARDACETAGELEAAVLEIDEAMTRMKHEVQATADSAAAARDDMAASLQEAGNDAEGVVADYASASERLMEGAEAEFDSATSAANEAKDAERELAVELASAGTGVEQASQEAAAETEALKNEAQAGIDAALADVQGVQAQVEAARSDAINAEAIVDAEVVKHGGESVLAKPANAQDSNLDNSAGNQESPAGSAASEGAGAARAPEAATDGAAESAADSAGAAASSGAGAPADAKEPDAATGGEARSGSMAAPASEDGGQANDANSSVAGTDNAAMDVAASAGASESGGSDSAATDASNKMGNKIDAQSDASDDDAQPALDIPASKGVAEDGKNARPEKPVADDEADRPELDVAGADKAVSSQASIPAGAEAPASELSVDDGAALAMPESGAAGLKPVKRVRPEKTGIPGAASAASAAPAAATPNAIKPAEDKQAGLQAASFKDMKAPQVKDLVEPQDVLSAAEPKDPGPLLPQNDAAQIAPAEPSVDAVQNALNPKTTAPEPANVEMTPEAAALPQAPAGSKEQAAALKEALRSRLADAVRNEII